MNRVISMRGRKGVVPPGVIYVGRSMRFYNLPLDASPFANPYKGPEALEEFSAMLRRYPLLRAKILADLPDKVLACWCGEFRDGDPIKCHAQILARVADGYDP